MLTDEVGATKLTADGRPRGEKFLKYAGAWLLPTVARGSPLVRIQGVRKERLRPSRKMDVLAPANYGANVTVGE